MKITLLALVVCSTAVASVQEQLRAIAAKADRLEIAWRPEFAVEEAGINRVKKVYQGAELKCFVEHITFVADNDPKPRGANDDVVTEESINCLCDGSHLLTFWRNNKIVAQMSFHHGTHLRSELLQDGRDALLTLPAQEWIQAEINWTSDVSKMELQQARKKPNQSLEPMPPKRHGSS